MSLMKVTAIRPSSIPYRSVPRSWSDQDLCSRNHCSTSEKRCSSLKNNLVSRCYRVKFVSCSGMTENLAVSINQIGGIVVAKRYLLKAWKKTSTFKKSMIASSHLYSPHQLIYYFVSKPVRNIAKLMLQPVDQEGSVKWVGRSPICIDTCPSLSDWLHFPNAKKYRGEKGLWWIVVFVKVNCYMHILLPTVQLPSIRYIFIAKLQRHEFMSMRGILYSFT